MSNEKYQKLSIVGMALAFGLVWGLGTLLTGWFAIAGWAVHFTKVLSSMYVGYTPTFWGGIIGGIWGFIDGFIGGGFIAFFYNFFCSRR